jgi:hypothetical protein
MTIEIGWPGEVPEEGIGWLSHDDGTVEDVIVTRAGQVVLFDGGTVPELRPGDSLTIEQRLIVPSPIIDHVPGRGTRIIVPGPPPTIIAWGTGPGRSARGTTDHDLPSGGGPGSGRDAAGPVSGHPGDPSCAV